MTASCEGQLAEGLREKEKSVDMGNSVVIVGERRVQGLNGKGEKYNKD